MAATNFSQLNESIPPGFVYLCQPRLTGQGGGLTMIHHEKWRVLPLSVPPYTSFESMVLQVTGPTPTIVANVYCPPKPNKGLIDEFSSLLTHLSPNVIVLSDFNIYMDNMNHIFTTFFTSSLDSFGFQQHINFPIQSIPKGHILDLVCCSGVSLFNCSSTDLPISDHMFISFNLNLTIFKTKTSRIICFRNIKDIYLTTPTMGIETLPGITFPSTTNEFPIIMIDSILC